MKEMRENRNKKSRKKEQMAQVNPSSSVITLHVSEPNSTSNKQRFAQWIKINLAICSLQETHFRSKDTNRLKLKEWKKILHINSHQNGVRVVILISDKIDSKIFKTCYRG